ncbi:MAG: SDR family oxidoreductase, partial [Pseudomonadota bacterium]
MELGLTGKVAAVAASSRGLGKAVALELVREGARVAICSRGGDMLAAAERELIGAAANGRAQVVAVACDLDSRDGPRTLVKAAVERWERLDVLVANNGGPPPGRVAAQDERSWHAAFERTFMATARLVAEAIPHLERAAAEPDGFARIVMLTSSAVREPLEELALSNTMRSAVSALMKTLSREVASRGITVNQVCPGRIDTDRLREIDLARARAQGHSPEEVRRNTEQTIPIGRYGRPAELAAVVAFLCSAKSS